MSLHSRVKRRGLEPRSGQRAHPRARRRTGPRDTRREHAHEVSPAAHARRAHRLFVAGRRVSNSSFFQDFFPPAPNSMHDDSDAESADAPASQGGLFFGVSVWAIGQDIGHRAGHLGHPPDCSPRSLDFGRAERMESIETQAPPVPCLHSDRVSRRSSAVRWNAKERRDDRSRQRALAEVRFTRAFPRPIRRVRRRERASAHSTNVSIIAIILFYCPAVPPSVRRGPSSTSLRRSERCRVHRHQSLTSIVPSSAASAPFWTRRA